MRGHDHHGHDSVRASVVEVELQNAHSAAEYAGMERYLRSQEGVTSVHLDRTRGVAHLGYDSHATTPDKLREALSRGGYRCDCYRCEGSRVQPGHPKLGAERVHEPGDDHTGVGHNGSRAAGHTMPDGAHRAMGHDEHAGHGANMVSDLLRRFVVSLVLTLPILAFSPMGAIVGLPATTPFGLSMGLFGFLLATPVVWWGGWPFISAAWRALRRVLAC